MILLKKIMQMPVHFLQESGQDNDEPEEAVLGKLDREMLMAAIEQLPEKAETQM